MKQSIESVVNNRYKDLKGKVVSIVGHQSHLTNLKAVKKIK